MKSIEIGNVRAGGRIGDVVACQIPQLLRSRGLVQASSGGGKSYMLRRLAEQAYGQVPVWIVDPEGEMSTLRERYPFYLVGKGGDTPADLRTVETVAQALRRHKASAIFDLFELKPEVRHRYVRALCEAITDSPKDLWTEMLFFLDEAHAFAPEKGQGESEAYGAVVDIACRGRKRGVSLVAFTQRLAKLSKNVTAELTNRFFGRTTEGNDVKRALDELSISREERDAFKHQIRRLSPGEFFCVGPAVSDDILQVKVGAVKTTHPEAGTAAPSTPPPPPAALKALLSKLGDLPKEAQEKARTKEALEAEIRSLRAQLAAKPTPVVQAPAATPKTVTVKTEVPVVGKREGERLLRSSEYAKKAAETLLAAATQIGQNIKEVESRCKAAAGRVDYSHVTAARAVAYKVDRGIPVQLSEARKTYTPPVIPKDTKIPKVERAILSVLSQHPMGCQSGKLTLLAGYRYSGGFMNALSSLRSKGLLTGPNTGLMQPTPAALELMSDKVSALPQGADLIEYWRGHPSFGQAAKKAFAAILDSRDGLTGEEAAAASGYAYSGGFMNGLSELRTAGVIVGKNTEKMRPCGDLLEAMNHA